VSPFHGIALYTFALYSLYFQVLIWLLFETATDRPIANSSFCAGRKVVIADVKLVCKHKMLNTHI